MKAIGDLYNDIIMIEKSEQMPSEDLFLFRDYYVFATKLRNRRQIPSEDFFLEITSFLRRELNSVYQSGLLSYLGLESEPQYEKS